MNKYIDLTEKMQRLLNIQIKQNKSPIEHIKDNLKYNIFRTNADNNKYTDC